MRLVPRTPLGPPNPRNVVCFLWLEHSHAGHVWHALTRPAQSAMVDAALVWRNLIATNTLPGIIIAPDEGSSASSSTSSSSSPSSSSASASCPLPVGLLAHSVGGGLAPYVVDTAARKGQPFKSVHVMAPQVGAAATDNEGAAVARGVKGMTAKCTA